MHLFHRVSTNRVNGAKIRIPCSTSNLGPGFDAIGLALQLYNTFTFERLSDGLEITIEGEGAGQLETGPDNRTYRSYVAVFEALSLSPYPVHIHQHNEIPLARGLGGSATAVLAGVIGALVLLDKEAKVGDVLGYATLIENHPDNLTPSMVGGLTVSFWEPGRIVYIRLDPPERLTSVVLIPDFTLETGQARRVLPRQVPLVDAVTNLRGSAMIMAAVATGEIDKLALAMGDRLHQPYRAPLLPGMYDIFQAALEAGSPGVALSGAGSGIFAFALKDGDPDAVGRAMVREAAAGGINSTYLILPIDRDGVRITKVSTDHTKEAL